MNKTWLATFVSLNCVLVSGAIGAERVPSVVLSLNTEPIYRGISESASNQAAAFNVDLPLSKKWLVGVGAGSILSNGNNQRERSITSHIGYNHELSNRVVLGGAVVHRAFPGAIKEWDYTELQASVQWNDNMTVTMAYADNYYDHDTAALSVGLDWFKAINANSYWVATLGTTQFDNAVISEYMHGKLGVGWRKGSMTAEINYGYTSRQDVVLFGEVIESPEFQFSVTYFAW